MKRSHRALGAAALLWGASALPAAGDGEKPVTDPEVATLLQKVAAAYGGREELLAYPGFRARGKILSVADGINASLRLSLSLDGAMRVEIRYPTRSEIRVLSGSLAWNGGRHRQRPSAASMASSIRLEYHRLAAPFEMASASADAFVADGVSEEGWTRLRRVWPEGFETVYEIDPVSGLIHRFRGILSEDDGGLEFVTESRDFREIGGVFFPFRTTTLKGEHLAAETILDRVTVEDAFDSETFLPTGSSGDI